MTAFLIGSAFFDYIGIKLKGEKAEGRFRRFRSEATNQRESGGTVPLLFHDGRKRGFIVKAVVDIGTNTVRMLIGEVKGGKVSVHGQFIAEPRLGVGITRQCLTPQGMERTMEALDDFKRTVRNYFVEDVTVVATSAVRDAINGKDFTEEVFRKIGWQVEILSGAAEAELSYAGAIASVKLPDGLPVVVDIGGGSTEVIFSRGGRVQGASVNVGAVRLSETAWSAEQLTQNLFPALQGLIHMQEKISLVAVGGTATTAAAIQYGITRYSREAVQGKGLSRQDIKRLKDDLAQMPADQRKKVIGLTPKRADIIVPGLRILVSILDQLGADGITVSDAGILDGLLLRKTK